MRTKLYNRRDDYHFHIVNLPFMYQHSLRQHHCFSLFVFFLINDQSFDLRPLITSIVCFKLISYHNWINISPALCNGWKITLHCTMVIGLPNNSYKHITIPCGFAPGFVNHKKGTLDSQQQVVKFFSCLPMVGGSLRVLRLLPLLKLVAMI